jgi:hypothetical protein
MALVICIGCLLVLHLVPSGLYPVRDPVSLYGTTRYHLLYRVQVIASGICALCLVAALTERHLLLPLVGLLMLVCYGIARMAIAAFMMDAHGKRTPTGSMHILLAALAFATIAVAAGMLTPSLLSFSLWKNLSVFLSLAEYLTILSALLFLLVSLLPVLRPFYGLIERGIYVGALCWLALVIIPLLR